MTTTEARGVGGEVAALQERYDFLFDAYVQGMCDGSELEEASRRLRAAKQQAGIA